MAKTKMSFEVGDLVWTFQPLSCRKLDTPWAGSGLIVNAYPDVNTYEVHMQVRLWKTRLINAKNLKSFRPQLATIQPEILPIPENKTAPIFMATPSAVEGLTL